MRPRTHAAATCQQQPMHAPDCGLMIYMSECQYIVVPALRTAMSLFAGCSQNKNEKNGIKSAPYLIGLLSADVDVCANVHGAWGCYLQLSRHLLCNNAKLWQDVLCDSHLTCPATSAHHWRGSSSSWSCFWGLASCACIRYSYNLQLASFPSAVWWTCASIVGYSGPGMPAVKL